MDAKDLDMLKKPKQAENGSVDYEQPEIKTDRTTDDLISRAEAIDVVKGIDSHFVKYIEALPSAQPEIIRCKDCIKRDYCRASTVWAVAPCDDWYCADAERREE